MSTWSKQNGCGADTDMAWTGSEWKTTVPVLEKYVPLVIGTEVMGAGCFGRLTLGHLG